MRKQMTPEKMKKQYAEQFKYAQNIKELLIEILVQAGDIYGHGPAGAALNYHFQDGYRGVEEVDLLERYEYKPTNDDLIRWNQLLDFGSKFRETLLEKMPQKEELIKKDLLDFFIRIILAELATNEDLK